MLELNSLSVVSFAIIFSHSEGCLFTLIIVSFMVQKLLSRAPKAKFAGYSRYFLTSYFCIPVPYDEKDIFFGVSSKRTCRSSQNCSTSTKLLCPRDFPGNITGVDCHFVLQGIFPTQGSNLGLPHCRQTLYHLNQSV